MLQARNEQVGLAAALVLLGALVAGLVWHAESRVRSHRATAEDALRHQAAVAAWQYHRFATEGLLHSVHAWTAPLAPMLHRSEQGIRRANGTAITMPRKRVCDICDTSRVESNYSFQLDLPTRAFAFIDSGPRPPSEVERRVLASRLGAAIGTGQAHEHEPHGLLVDTIGGVLRAVAYGVARTPNGPREVYGVDIDPSHVADALSKPLREALLPPGLLGRISTDSLLHIGVRTRGGVKVYESGARPVTTVAAADTLESRLGSLVTTISVRPERASALVIGGLPRTNWPLLSAILALAALLMVLALLQLRRMRELTRVRNRFVASVSHELRTPLAQISMFSETLLLDRARSDSERLDFLSAIFREARRLSNLVESVLRFSRAQGTPANTRLREPELQDVTAEVNDVLRGFAPLAAASDVELLSDVETGIEARVEPGAIRQLLLNLLDNAIKYGPRGQTVTVRLERQGSMLRVAVEDEGPGVPPSERHRVFEPFARLEGDGRAHVAGTGIGLSVVRDIAAGHEGRAWIESGPSGGARAVVEIPLASERERCADAAANRSTASGDAGAGAPLVPRPSSLQ